jgi:hypothetical protein
MQAVTLQKYWQFGTGFRFLQDAKEGYPIHGAQYVLGNISAVFRKLDEFELKVTKRATDPLKRIDAELKTTPADAKLTAPQARKLSTVVKDLRQTLEAELKGLNAYIISPKRIDVERLVGDVSSLFAPGVYESLSDICRLDLSEAGKCIAFERPTAAAFHMMRAAEEALRRYYCHFVKRERLSPMMWGPMVKALQVHRRAKSNGTLHANLDNIRLSFRNPTQHPDKIYDIQEAQDLWALTVEAISRMDRAMKSAAA